MQCGARQPAVAEALSETTPLPEVAPVPEVAPAADASPPMDLAALEAQAAALVGQSVAFRSLSPRSRKLRAAPDPGLPPLPDIMVGRCTAVEARGAWLQLAHSSGARGWCPVTNVKLRAAAQSDASRATGSRATTPAPELAAIEALERLHALHAAGGLTDEEFARAKKSVLESKPGA